MMDFVATELCQLIRNILQEWIKDSKHIDGVILLEICTCIIIPMMTITS